MPTISAVVQNQQGSHTVMLTTNQTEHGLVIPPKSSGSGSSANGGELLFLALATCYCNDIYREAAKQQIIVQRVEVKVSGEFGDAPGSVAQNVTYCATVEAQASEEAILALMHHTDTVAEIQNTLRQGMSVTLIEAIARPVP
ncbi:MAG: OsmC family protein [Anaerolineae bacterium]|nr:MAG: OsmC family protein [Anaerolineae bacterium]